MAKARLDSGFGYALVWRFSVLSQETTVSCRLTVPFAFHHTSLYLCYIHSNLVKGYPATNLNYLQPCNTLAMNIPVFPKVEEARIVEGYEMALRFNNGEERLVNFRRLLDPQRELEKQLLDDEKLFRRFKVEEGTLVWPELDREGKDFEGRTQFFAFDIDPGLLYEESTASADSSEQA